MSALYTGTRLFGRTVRSNWRPLIAEVSLLLFVLAAIFLAIVSGIHAARASATAEYLGLASVVDVAGVEGQPRKAE